VSLSGTIDAVYVRSRDLRRVCDALFMAVLAHFRLPGVWPD
jgi:hypothetical protein